MFVEKESSSSGKVAARPSSSPLISRTVDSSGLTSVYGLGGFFSSFPFFPFPPGLFGLLRPVPPGVATVPPGVVTCSSRSSGLTCVPP